VGPPATPAPAAGAVAAVHRGVLNPGRYRDTVFDPNFTFTIPAGWEATTNAADYFELGHDQSLGFALLDVVKIQAVSSTGCYSDGYVPVGPKPADLIGFLRGNKHLKTSGFRATSFGAYSGQQLTIQLRSLPTCSDGGT